MNRRSEDLLDSAIRQVKRDAYDAGLSKGLEVAEKIIEWLNIQPTRKWAQKIREYAIKELEKTKKVIDSCD